MKLNNFNLICTLGVGSFGRVHLARSTLNLHYYAIKVMRKLYIVRKGQINHIMNEKHLLEFVNHPFLIKLWGTFQDNNNLYMVMDYVPGGELFTLLQHKKIFPERAAKFYAAEIFLALRYLHYNNIVYRDLKPENLLLDKNGHIKIVDFGFSKHCMSLTWTMCGTPEYVAPEVILGKGSTKAVDWWSFGILIYEMLAGQSPFFSKHHWTMLKRIVQGDVVWPSHFHPHAIDLLQHLLTRDVSRRYGHSFKDEENIQKHAWFGEIDFDAIASKTAFVPYKPRISKEGDAHYFCKYEEPTEPYGLNCLDLYREEFIGF
ncbi:kinase-like domain-containing protein [Spinellus fusiger]|nr:kinase-like domain-containing protein [Spinellus fusiger]